MSLIVNSDVFVWAALWELSTSKPVGMDTTPRLAKAARGVAGSA
jgi:hypothetical protein